MGSRLEANSAQTRKRIQNHTFSHEEGDEYEGSKFGGFHDYFRRKKIKLQNLDVEIRANSDKPAIFRGIVAHVNGYTQPSLNDLHTMIVAHGGGFVQYLDGKTLVTHIIASSLTPKKAIEFKRYRIVKPAWIVDSIAAGKLLPWDNYRVVDEGVGQKVLAFGNGQVVSQANKQAKGYRGQSDASWYTSRLRGANGQNVTHAQTFARRPPFVQGSASSGTLAVTPEYDDIHDSDFEGLDEPGEQGLQESTEAASAGVRDEATTSSFLAELQSGPETLSPLIAGNSLGLYPSPAGRPDTAGQAGLDVSPQMPPGSSPPGNHVESDVATLQPTSPYGVEGSDPRGMKRSRSHSPTPRKAPNLTAEEHNAVLLADPRLRQSTVLNPNFLEQYYRESRLHHLSTWKADLKSQLQALTAEKSASQKARQKRPAGARRYILHVDFDSFFAAVSLKKHPQYKEKPAVVAHGAGSGSEIASCNYPARKFGISNGMWMKRAQELCPDLKVLPYDFPGYEEASRTFYDAILATGGVVQSVSIDEALIDVSAQCIAIGGTDGIRRSEGSNHHEQSHADKIAQGLRDKVLELTGCNVSVGIGGNILLAKVALRKAKPAGQYQLKPEEVLDFIGNLEVQSLPGVAYSIGGKLEEIGVKYVKDIRELSKEKLINTLGPKTGEKIWEFARGIDKAEVGDQVIRKSVSCDVNWGVRFENQTQVDEFMQNLCSEVQKRLVKENVKGGQISVKIMRRAPDAPLDPPKSLGHGKCIQYNKSVQLGVATNDSAIITKEVLAIMRGFGISPGELRGLAVQMTKLEPLKAGADGKLDGSQKRLQFKTAQPKKPISKAVMDSTEDPITDDIETPKKKRVRDVTRPGIPEVTLNSNSPSKRPLNTLGTQFALPTQVDPRVLAELPEDIRAKLTRQSRAKPVLDEQDGRRSPTPMAKGRPPAGPTTRVQSPAVNLPNQSQLDPEILDSLPDDVRRDVLAMYQPVPSSPRKPRDQTILPQSPRKNRTIPPVKRITTREPRGGGLFARAKPSNDFTLTQANFVARPDTDSEDPCATEDIDEEFLKALPPDIRKEVLDERRAAQMRRTGGLALNKRGRKPAFQPNTIERMFKLPPKPPRPSFTFRKLTDIADLRTAVRDWVKEFSDEAPYPEDVGALAGYLEQVVKEERDVSKAVKIVKWLDWCVEQLETEVSDDVKAGWRDATGRVQEGVQEAVRERGLPDVEFGR